MSVVRNRDRYFSVSTKDTPHAKAACQRKADYGSEQAARRIGRDRLRENGEEKHLWPYACVVCRRWHLTSSGAINEATVAISAREMWVGTGM